MKTTLPRRDFIAATLAASIPGILGAGAAESTATAETSKPARIIKLGIIGLGGRGHWIGGLFQQHGGYQIHAVADYFPGVVEQQGAALGVDPSRRFSGLSGYKRVLESGVEAVVIIDIPYFYPEQARAAVEAGLHVYMAKPIAVDVPGTMSVAESGKLATARERVFMIDYQMPTDPYNIEVVKRIHEGALGKVSHLQSFGISSGFADPPKTATIESRMQNLIWVNDVALGCDNIGNYDIHAIDAALWIAGSRPIAAAGASQIARANPHGDARDVCSVVFEYADGLVHNHFGQALPNKIDSVLMVTCHGPLANAQVHYSSKAFVRGGPKHYGGGKVTNLYQAGAVRNIAAFHEAVTTGRCENPTIPRAVDGVLTCILGREAAARHTRLTMEELLNENTRLEVDLKGLMA